MHTQKSEEIQRRQEREIYRKTIAKKKKRENNAGHAEVVVSEKQEHLSKAKHMETNSILVQLK